MSQQTSIPAAGEGPSFASQVRGQDAKEIDLTLAKLMADLYDDHYGRDRPTNVDGWSALSDDQLKAVGIDPNKLHDESSGFRSLIYGDGKGHYVLAFSGTDEGKDWLTNFRQGLGFEDAQYNQAMALAKDARVAFGDEVVITGHSLGGGLAGAAAIASGIPAVTFNASGVHDKTIRRLGLDPDAVKEYAEDGLVRRYAVKNEILTDLQEKSIPLKWAMPDAVGHKIELPDPNPQNFWQKLNPISDIKHDVKNHYIDAVISAMALAKPEWSQDRGTVLSDNGASGARSAGASLADPNHPGYALFDQSLRGLQKTDMAALGLRSEQDVQNAAASAALAAKNNGFDRIDHLVPDRNGSGFFLIAGDLSDPGHRRVFVDAEKARTQPMEQSAAQLQSPQPEHLQSEREQRRTMSV
ncbi:XVIPCD domain-containing protein [Luteimonas panaciterrae]|uniref:XVIPCD domain-containing protein n=1 Tax=Luteimonas panaciterrae TaxID=363885 RepID=UPI001CFAB117|nr:XVIPCD domain-containing protein [Luteimonas panaciterrae]